MRKIIAALSLAVAAALASSGTLAQDKAKLAIPTFSLTLTPIYVAFDKGLWKAEGLDIDMPLIAGIGATNALLAGSVDFTVTTAASFTRAIGRGQKLIAIANTLEKVQIEIVVTKAWAEKNGMSPTDPIAKRTAALKGARIAVDAPNTIVHGYVRYASRAAGLDPDRDITVSPMQPPAMLQALKSGQVDGFAMSRPWASMVRRDGIAVTLASSPLGDFPELNPFGYNMIITRPGVCEANPATCKKLIAGVRKALELMHDKPDEVLAVLKKRFDKTDPDLVEDAYKGVIAGTPRTPEVKEAGLANAQQLMLKAGQIKQDELLKSFAGIYTNEYAK